MIHVREQDGALIITDGNLGSIRLSKAQARQLAAQLKKLCTTATKYGNKRITAYGREWDSTVELEFYEHLLQLHKSDEITIQPKFILQNKQAGLREISYIADFQVGALVFDVKGFQTSDSKLKVKMFKARYPVLSLSLVNKCPLKYQHTYGKWIDIGVLNKLRSAAKRAIKKAKNEVE